MLAWFFNELFYLHYICCSLFWSPIPQFLIPFLLSLASRHPPSQGVSILSRIKSIFHRDQTRLSSNIYVPGALDQPMYCCLVDGSLDLWDLLRVQVSWDCWSFYGDPLPFSFFNPSPNTSIGVPDLSSKVVYKYLFLSQSTACWTFQGTTMLDSHL